MIHRYGRSPCFERTRCISRFILYENAPAFSLSRIGFNQTIYVVQFEKRSVSDLCLFLNLNHFFHFIGNIAHHFFIIESDFSEFELAVIDSYRFFHYFILSTHNLFICQISHRMPPISFFNDIPVSTSTSTGLPKSCSKRGFIAVILPFANLPDNVSTSTCLPISASSSIRRPLVHMTKGVFFVSSGTCGARCPTSRTTFSISTQVPFVALFIFSASLF